MNRNEVVMTIKKVGAKFGRVMSELCGEEYAAGYNRAIDDMVRLFNDAPIDPDFEHERKAMRSQIEELMAKNEELEREVCEKHATIQTLMDHVNIAEVLGVGANSKKREEPKVKRRVAIFAYK